MLQVLKTLFNMFKPRLYARKIRKSQGSKIDETYSKSNYIIVDPEQIVQTGNPSSSPVGCNTFLFIFKSMLRRPELSCCFAISQTVVLFQRAAGTTVIVSFSMVAFQIL